MFDDPRKELERLQQELLAAEKSDEAFERFYDEILEEFGEKNTEEDEVLNDLLADSPVRGNQSQKQNAYPSQGRNDYTDSQRRPKKAKGVGGLIALICVECLGIAGVVAWWLIRLI